MTACICQNSLNERLKTVIFLKNIKTVLIVLTFKRAAILSVYSRDCITIFEDIAKSLCLIPLKNVKSRQGLIVFLKCKE